MSEVFSGDSMASLLLCVPVYLWLFLWVHTRADWRQTFQSASQTVPDVCQMFVLALSQQIALFHLNTNEQCVVFIISSATLCKWSVRKPIYSTAPSFSLSLFAATQQSFLLGSPASEANLRNEPVTCFFPLLWSEVNGVCFFSVNNEPQCESSSHSQLWKLCFRWLYVVIISSSHVTQWCVRVCLSLYVRARLWAGACLCLHDSRSEREVTRAAAEGWERQTLRCCRGGEKGVRERGAGKPQTDKKVRQEQRS